MNWVTASWRATPRLVLAGLLSLTPMDEDTGGSMLREAVAQHADTTPMAGLWYLMLFRDNLSPLTGNAF